MFLLGKILSVLGRLWFYFFDRVLLYPLMRLASEHFEVVMNARFPIVKLLQIRFMNLGYEAQPGDLSAMTRTVGFPVLLSLSL